MRTSSGDQPPTLQPHYRVYAAVVSRRTPWLGASGVVRGAKRLGTLPAHVTTRREFHPRVGCPMVRHPEAANPDGRPEGRSSRPRCLTGQELVRRPGNPVQRGTRPTAGARTRSGPKSDPGCVDDSRAGHTRESKRRDATSWGRGPGSDASVHDGAEAVSWSQAPGCQSGRSCCEHLRNLQRPVASSTRRSERRPRCRVGLPHEVEGRLDGAVRLSPERRSSGCRLPPAEAG